MSREGRCPTSELVVRVQDFPGDGQSSQEIQATDEPKTGGQLSRCRELSPILYFLEGHDRISLNALTLPAAYRSLAT